MHWIEGEWADCWSFARRRALGRQDNHPPEPRVGFWGGVCIGLYRGSCFRSQLADGDEDLENEAVDGNRGERARGHTMRRDWVSCWRGWRGR